MKKDDRTYYFVLSLAGSICIALAVFIPTGEGGIDAITRIISFGFGLFFILYGFFEALNKIVDRLPPPPPKTPKIMTPGK
jgi:hypothetical protein